MDTKEFQKIVWKYYKKNGRHTLPWRRTTNPYRILVSEIMLQQTQVSRVIPKYKEFLRQFPTIQKLSTAPLAQVLTVWQGLGYNRRAKYLHNTAKKVCAEHNSILPKTVEELRTLPGIGDYTARAVCVFAYKQPLPMIETNIRTVFIHHFFSQKKHVSDTEVLFIVEKILVTKKPREWNWALMDYGSHLKEQKIFTHRQSKHYAKQSPFKDSNREARGMIIRELSKGKPLTVQKLKQESGFLMSRIKKQLTELEKEKLVKQSVYGKWSLYTI